MLPGRHSNRSLQSCTDSPGYNSQEKFLGAVAKWAQEVKDGVPVSYPFTDQRFRHRYENAAVCRVLPSNVMPSLKFTRNCWDVVQPPIQATISGKQSNSGTAITSSRAAQQTCMGEQVLTMCGGACRSLLGRDAEIHADAGELDDLSVRRALLGKAGKGRKKVKQNPTVAPVVQIEDVPNIEWERSCQADMILKGWSTS